MPHWLIDGMIYLGSLLMVYNIYGFSCYAGKLKKRGEGIQRPSCSAARAVKRLMISISFGS